MAEPLDEPPAQARTPDTIMEETSISIEQLTDKDVIFGRGLTLSSRDANTKFRSMLFSHTARYRRSSKLGKDKFVSSIVHEALKKGIRFYKRNPGEGMFVSRISVESSIEKVKQAIRDISKITKNRRREAASGSENVQLDRGESSHKIGGHDEAAQPATCIDTFTALRQHPNQPIAQGAGACLEDHPLNDQELCNLLHLFSHLEAEHNEDFSFHAALLHRAFDTRVMIVNARTQIQQTLAKRLSDNLHPLNNSVYACQLYPSGNHLLLGHEGEPGATSTQRATTAIMMQPICKTDLPSRMMLPPSRQQGMTQFDAPLFANIEANLNAPSWSRSLFRQQGIPNNVAPVSGAPDAKLAPRPRIANEVSLTIQNDETRQNRRETMSLPNVVSKAAPYFTQEPHQKLKKTIFEANQLAQQPDSILSSFSHECYAKIAPRSDVVSDLVASAVDTVLQKSFSANAVTGTTVVDDLLRWATDQVLGEVVAVDKQYTV